MTVAVTLAAARGATTVICASTGNTSASAAAYAARAGLTARCSCRRARSRSASWRRRWCTAPGCSRSTATSTTAWNWCASSPPSYPVALVNSVNPDRLAGPEDRGVRDRATRSATRRTCTACRSATRATSPPTGCGYTGVPGRRPGDARRRGCSASRPPAPPRSCTAQPVLRPGHDRDRDPDRQPGVLAAGRGGQGRVRRDDRRGHRRADPRRLPAAGGRRGCSASPPRRPAWPGCCRPARPGRSSAGSVVVCTITGTA